MGERQIHGVIVWGIPTRPGHPPCRNFPQRYHAIMRPIHPYHQRSAVVRLIAPPLIAIALFVVGIWGLILPATEAALLERKRETLRAIVASAISLCERHQRAEADGARAQALAAADLRALRYGEANKDYLWVIDATPRMIVHPYRPDLEGQEVGAHADPDGVRLFAASVARVHDAGEGFVHYRWQKADDAAHTAPKLSFVRGFAPWGWVVGSGIYLDDVHAELARTTRTLGWIAGGVAAVVAALVALGLRQGWASERARRAAEQALADEHARAQALAHATSEAVWLVVDGRIAGANRRAGELVGDVAGPSALFSDPADRVLVEGPGGPRRVLLAGRTGALPALVASDEVTVGERPALVITARLLDGAEVEPGDLIRRAAAEAQNDAVAVAQAGLLAPAEALAETVPHLPLTAAPGEVIAALAASGGSAALLTAPDGGVAGLVTAGDLARRGGATAYAAMSAPVRSLEAGASLAAAADAMAGARVGRLAVRDAAGSTRLLSAARLLDALRQGPGQLVAAAAQAEQARLPALRARLEAWMGSLARVRLDPELAAIEGTRVADAVLNRCVALALAELGPPPAACALLAVGSQGRRELLPGADQDNLLVFADGADPRWFHAFAADVVARYHAAGWPRCHGGCHAADPRWCLPLADWSATYAGWIARAEPRALLEAAVFFDIRLVWGDEGLAGALHAAMRTAVAARPVFLVQLAQETLQARSPLGLFGGIRPDDERQGTTNLKLAMLHIAGFARVRALAHGLAAHGTGARLRALAEAGHLDREAADEAVAAWRFLLGLRLVARTSARGDQIAPDALDPWERANLRRALACIDTLRERLRHDLSRLGA